jgi:quercetin dioxygenase-like cupin family protein
MTTPSLPDRTDGTATGAGGAPPFAAPAGEGELIDIGTAAFLVRATADGTGGVLTMFEELPPLLDTSRHVHRYEDETFYVLDGEVTLHVAGQHPLVLQAGEAAFAPRGVPHVYVVTSSTPAHWLGTSTGHQFASFVEALSTPAAEPTLPTDVEIDPGHVAAVAARHGIELLGPPGMLPQAAGDAATA